VRRHSILIRLSPADAAPVEILQKDSLVSQIRFVDGHRNMGFDLGWMVRQLIERGIVPTENRCRSRPFLAAISFLRRTRACRALTMHQDGLDKGESTSTCRSPDRPRWESLTNLLERTLRFLTGDHWRILLRSRPTSHALW
jgi:hypothetical protein